MGYSTKIYFRKDYIRKDGTCGIYLQVIIDRKKKVIPLDLYWPVELCEDSQALCKPRNKEDIEADDLNIILRDNLSKANKIFKHFRMNDEVLTMDRFMSKWKYVDVSNESFLEYFERRNNERMSNSEYSYWSYKRYDTTLSWLRRFKKEIYFSDLNEKWAFNFDNFLKRNIHARNADTTNTRWGYHKYVKVVLNYARDIEGIQFTDPYKYFKISQKKGNKEPLTEDEVVKLYEFYRFNTIGSERMILRRFLFGVATSLRIADLRKLETSWRDGDALQFIPQKTERKIGKSVKIPLSDMAKRLWDDAVREVGGRRLFMKFEPQHGNRILKKIAEDAGIEKNLHNHVSRHTWTTLFLSRGGSLRTAQMILGHESVTTTEKYDHPDFKQAAKELAFMEFLKPL